MDHSHDMDNVTNMEPTIRMVVYTVNRRHDALKAIFGSRESADAYVEEQRKEMGLAPEEDDMFVVREWTVIP